MGHQGIISAHLWSGKFHKVDMCECVDGHKGTRGTQVGEDEFEWAQDTCQTKNKTKRTWNDEQTVINWGNHVWGEMTDKEGWDRHMTTIGHPAEW